MKRVFQKPYIYWTIGIFFAYLALNFAVSGFYNTLKLIFIYAGTVNWIKLSFSLLLTLIIGGLVAINGVSAYIKYKERRNCLQSSAIAGAGTLGGLAVGICPLCAVGLFPLIFGALGISFSFGSLPFQGLEVQVLTALVLMFSLALLYKK